MGLPGTMAIPRRAGDPRRGTRGWPEWEARAWSDSRQARIFPSAGGSKNFEASPAIVAHEGGCLIFTRVWPKRSVLPWCIQCCASFLTRMSSAASMDSITMALCVLRRRSLCTQLNSSVQHVYPDNILCTPGACERAAN